MAAATLAIRRIDTRQQDAQALLADLRERLSPRGAVVSEAGRRRTVEVFGQELTPLEVVERICETVRERGVEAVLDYSRRIDGAELTRDSLRVTAAELSAAHAASDPEFLAAVRRIRDNISAFQSELVPRDHRLATAGGGYLMARYSPLARVGICVPGGAAAYPSTVLMTAVPAQAAGVEQLAVVAPPTKFGAYNPDLLATCHELGIREVYRVGGAQAVAALAYGVEGLPKVDKIVGPGNLFVALAKKRVYGDVDIDSIAGPSEVVVIADGSPPPSYIAADLIAQAEHAPGASILISWSDELLEGVAGELERQTRHLARGDLARQSLERFGALVRVRDAEEAVQLANEIAPEHLHLAFEAADSLLAKIRNAGAVFVGPYSPVAVGDYVAGPSHVLPTGGTARFASGLSARDFVRSSSVIHFTREDLARSAADLRIMAEKEGLTAHRASVDIRLDEKGEPRSGGASPS
ncbi:MAG TPA: histidinol dehydrogenase [Pirellulales bacterium]|jgi:histidinol dehydrogenase|nr:histidinol dehydrogenase [Pirellulales bacterium]